ncbi:MAG: carboxypeptidase regulatory-like domain-containing protein [Bacteroidales bacterium]|nr:carboxypeptidase regulatory-like domain-containing protein [Bacteroidales bacterium]
MKRKNLLIIAGFLLIFFSFSCSKDIVLTGSVQGTVDILTNEFGDTLSLSGIKVTLVSKLYGNKETTTDAYGKYFFENVETGTYELIIGEAPIAPYKHYFQFVGGEASYIAPFIKLTHKSTSIPSNIRLTTDDWGNNYIECDITPIATPETPRRFLLISYKYDSLGNFKYYTLSTKTVTENVLRNNWRIFEYEKFKIIIYGVSNGEYTKYIDTLGNEIIPSLGDISTDTLYINF